MLKRYRSINIYKYDDPDNAAIAEVVDTDYENIRAAFKILPGDQQIELSKEPDTMA